VRGLKIQDAIDGEKERGYRKRGEKSKIEGSHMTERERGGIEKEGIKRADMTERERGVGDRQRRKRGRV
jgi:hypothetical protein